MTDSSFKDISWQDVCDCITQIEHSLSVDQWKPDMIVGIANGGVIPATLLSKRLSIPVRTAIVQLRDGSIQERNHDVEIAIRNGKNVLFVDDINDTGATLQHIKDTWYIDESCWGNNVRTAVLHTKFATRFGTDYQTYTFDSDTWVVYPWEV